MFNRLRASLTFANVTALLALVLAMGGGAYALSIPGASGVFHGCVSKANGALRVVAPGTRCRGAMRVHGRLVAAGEFAIVWNQRGAPGLQGPPGTVDTSQFYTKSQSDSRYQQLGEITYGSASNALNGQPVVSWPQMGFEIRTAGPTSLGNIALTITDTGTQNINGEAILHNGPPMNIVSATAFGLKPGETTDPPYSTGGPFIDFSIVTSSANPAFAADVRCMNVTSGGVTRAHCWVLRSG